MSMISKEWTWAPDTSACTLNGSFEIRYSSRSAVPSGNSFSLMPSSSLNNESSNLMSFNPAISSLTHISTSSSWIARASTVPRISILRGATLWKLICYFEMQVPDDKKVNKLITVLWNLFSVSQLWKFQHALFLKTREGNTQFLKNYLVDVFCT